ncbi:MAG: YceI family protein [Pseudomarimonas sp.]
MTRILLPLLFAFAACFGASTVHAAEWQTAAGSTLGFSAEAQGEKFSGVFSRFEARIRFAPDALTASRFEVEIDLKSVDSQNSERDEMLADEAFFNSAAEPKASYFAERFSQLEDGRFRAEGVLTLRGVSAPVPLDFTWTGDASTATLEGEAVLDRVAFKVGAGEWEDAEAIAHQVSVNTKLVLTAKPSSTP